MILLGLSLLATTHAQAGLPSGAKISLAVLSALHEHSQTDVLVLLEDPTPRLTTSPELASLQNKIIRRAQWVESARGSQRELRALLSRWGVPHRAYYLVNMVAIPRAEAGLIRQLAVRQEVARIEINPRVPGSDLATKARSELVADQTGAVPLPWNLERIGADKAWAAGIAGRDVVVAGNDTGVDWTHPALKRQYRGFHGGSPDHNYNWHDAVAGTSEPQDPQGHGTLTLGVIVGDDGVDKHIGVAPDAQWIACRNMDTQGYGTPETYIGCLEFFLAPYPLGGDPIRDGDPDRAPHIINNSWSCLPREGCSLETLLTAVQRVRAAGILFVASAGNKGPSCGSATAPPAIYDAAFSVGSTEWSDEIAAFSSRGPVALFGKARSYPELSAPGVVIRSSAPGGGYESRSGTSMAAAHVSGAAALILSAVPRLMGQVDLLEDALRRGAVSKPDAKCGGSVPNNTYGWGRLDAFSAITYALEAKR